MVALLVLLYVMQITLMPNLCQTWVTTTKCQSRIEAFSVIFIACADWSWMAQILFSFLQSLSDDLRRESFRLSSFQRFPASVPIDARKFAAAGFYYTGQFDEVKCFACSNTQRNLSLRTDPFLLSMHRFVSNAFWL